MNNSHFGQNQAATLDQKLTKSQLRACSTVSHHLTQNLTTKMIDNMIDEIIFHKC